MLDRVCLANDIVHNIVSVGDTKLSLPCGLLMQRHVFHHTPSLRQSLISIDFLFVDGCHLVLDEHKFLMYCNWLVLARGTLANGLCAM